MVTGQGRPDFIRILPRYALRSWRLLPFKRAQRAHLQPSYILSILQILSKKSPSWIPSGRPWFGSVLLSGHFALFVHVFRPNSFPGFLLAFLVFLCFLFSCLAVP